LEKEWIDVGMPLLELEVVSGNKSLDGNLFLIVHAHFIG
jgi:hypothetical protein